MRDEAVVGDAARGNTVGGDAEASRTVVSRSGCGFSFDSVDLDVMRTVVTRPDFTSAQVDADGRNAPNGDALGSR